MTDLTALFATKNTPTAVGRLAGKLMDTTNHKAGDIKNAKEARLAELADQRRNSSTTPARSQADRIDAYARRNRIRMR